MTPADGRMHDIPRTTWSESRYTSSHPVPRFRAVLTTLNAAVLRHLLPDGLPPSRGPLLSRHVPLPLSISILLHLFLHRSTRRIVLVTSSRFRLFLSAFANSCRQRWNQQSRWKDCTRSQCSGSCRFLGEVGRNGDDEGPGRYEPDVGQLRERQVHCLSRLKGCIEYCIARGLCLGHVFGSAFARDEASQLSCAEQDAGFQSLRSLCSLESNTGGPVCAASRRSSCTMSSPLRHPCRPRRAKLRSPSSTLV